MSNDQQLWVISERQRKLLIKKVFTNKCRRQDKPFIKKRYTIIHNIDSYTG